MRQVDPNYRRANHKGDELRPYRVKRGALHDDMFGLIGFGRAISASVV
jgi:hypothetical protein